MSDAIAVLNAGSSSLKFSLFAERGDALELTVRGQIEGLHTAPRFVAKDRHGKTLGEKSWADGVKLGHDGALDHLVAFLRAELGKQRLTGVGHRVVHGGLEYSRPVRVDATVLSALEKYVPLAPLHQPHNLAPDPRPASGARRSCLRSLASTPHSTVPSPRWHRHLHSRGRSPTAA